MRIAITREVSPNLARCELTHVARAEIDAALASRQHHRYEQCLKTLGCEVRTLRAEPDLPDSVFVEDAAIVVDEIAVVTRPGAASRRPEAASVEAALCPFRTIARIEPPGTLEGGDVLVVDRIVYVGLSGRTNLQGYAQLCAHLGPFGYSVAPVEIAGCLHLKSAVTQVGEGLLLINPEWLGRDRIPAEGVVEVDPAEPFAANALRIGESVIVPAAFERTIGRLEAAGVRVVPVDVSELAKAEGGVTCCSLIFDR